MRTYVFFILTHSFTRPLTAELYVHTVIQKICSDSVVMRPTTKNSTWVRHQFITAFGRQLLGLGWSSTQCWLSFWSKLLWSWRTNFFLVSPLNNMRCNVNSVMNIMSKGKQSKLRLKTFRLLINSIIISQRRTHNAPRFLSLHNSQIDYVETIEAKEIIEYF